MEVEYLIERLGPYLGGIDVEKVKAALAAGSAAAVERILGIRVEEPPFFRMECARAAALARHYAEEEKRLRILLAEAKAAGASPADLAALWKRLRAAKHNHRLYKKILKKCKKEGIR
ncbi:MAG: hypothetical protein QXI07_08975 [Pyrobaculum sp.]